MSAVRRALDEDARKHPALRRAALSFACSISAKPEDLAMLSDEQRDAFLIGVGKVATVLEGRRAFGGQP